MHPFKGQPRHKAPSTPQEQHDHCCSGNAESTKKEQDPPLAYSREPDNAAPPIVQEFECSKGLVAREAAASKTANSLGIEGCGSQACNCNVNEATAPQSTGQDNDTANAEHLSGKVLFGSQKGTSAKFARLLAERAAGQGMQLTVSDLAAFEVEQVWKERLVVIVTSTYEDGTPPQNARCSAAT